jgi:hypothetical protein
MGYPMHGSYASAPDYSNHRSMHSGYSMEMQQSRPSSTSSSSISPPPSPTGPGYRGGSFSCSQVFVTEGGQEIEFLETAMNTPLF